MDSGQEPGQLIVPHGSGDPQPSTPGAPEPERPAEIPEPAPSPAPPSEPILPAVADDPAPETPAEPIDVPPPAPVSPEQVTASVPPAEPGNWQFHTEAPAVSPEAAPVDPSQTISWTASEFIAHEKSPGWYALLALAAIIVAALVYLITTDKVSTAAVVFITIILGVLAARRPRTREYSLSARGVQIGAKSYSLQDFKAFSVAQEGTVTSVVFMPLKRFMPPLTIYLATEVEDRALSFLGATLPLEQHQPDALDSLLKRIHF